MQLLTIILIFTFGGISIGSTTLLLTRRLIRNAKSAPLPLSHWPDDLSTASQVVFRPFFLYKHKQEEKRINKEQKKKEEAEKLVVHFLDHQQNGAANQYYFDPYYYYYYQQYYNRPEYQQNHANIANYNTNEIRRQQQLLYKA